MSHANFNEYVSYFESIARSLVAIGHTDDKKHFYRLEFEDVLTALPAKITWPAMILEGYDIHFIDNRSDNVLKIRTGAFIIMDKVANIQDFDSIHAVYDKCEVICDDIISKMYSDKQTRQHKVVKDFDLSKVEIILIANDVEGAYGMRVSFPIVNTHDIEVNPSKWNNL